jgi:hypothetical protein
MRDPTSKVVGGIREREWKLRSGSWKLLQMSPTIDANRLAGHEVAVDQREN